MSDYFSTAQVASQAGVHRDTLLRWLREGRVPEPGRDGRGWRTFSAQEVKAIVSLAINATRPIDRPPAIAHLQAADWDLTGARTSYLTHSIHPYPAKFIPQIPNMLIQELSSVGDTVADIFCGSGTTLLEAVQLKRDALDTARSRRCRKVLTYLPRVTYRRSGTAVAWAERTREYLRGTRHEGTARQRK